MITWAPYSPKLLVAKTQDLKRSESKFKYGLKLNINQHAKPAQAFLEAQGSQPQKPDDRRNTINQRILAFSL